MSLSATSFGNKTTEETVSWDESMLEQSGPLFNETLVLTETRNSDESVKMPATRAEPYYL